LGRTSGAVGATNINEAVKQIQQYNLLNFAYPNDWDSLLTSGGQLFEGLDRNAIGPVNGDISAEIVDGDEATALFEAGITRALAMVNPTGGSLPTGYSVTFRPYAANALADAIDIEPGTAVTLARLNPVVAAQVLNKSADASYVIFGLGDLCTIVGNGINSAPVHVAGSGQRTPDRVYSRYGVVFQTTNSSGQALSRARFAGVVALDGNGIRNASTYLEDYYQESAPSGTN
ncbi:MAG: hypothetical protein EA380_06830, partial [Phycisphaeraceae bacterium]